MTALLRSELLKLRTTRSSLTYPLALVALVAVGAAGNVGSAPELERQRPDFLAGLVANASFSALVALIVGIVATTNEFRHGTITPTLLVTPARERLVAAKALAATMWGTGLGVLALAVVLAVGVPWLAAVDAPHDLAAGDVWRATARMVCASAAAAALGAVVGGAVHSQVGALVGALLWILVGETLLGALLPTVGADGVSRYLPGQAIAALGAHGSGDDALSFWAALAVTLAYVAVIGALALVRTVRRDIT